MDIPIADGDAATDVGSYFVANYPPFSLWSAEHVPVALKALRSPVDDRPDAGNERPPLGLYLHIPFCRKRCSFCYYRVYTDKHSNDIDLYLGALVREAALHARGPALSDRPLEFVYFGGGTPSFLSSEQLKQLIDRLRDHWTWDHAREVTFECEPGTLKKSKLEAIKAIGTTRLSLGIEHFDREVLAMGGRAHQSAEGRRSYEWAREVGFDQINIDLIAGMPGDTEVKWKGTVVSALELQPDSVTIYQMELPHNTVLSQEAKTSGTMPPVASWRTKRLWVDHAFRQFEQAGYHVSSAYTLVKNTKADGRGDGNHPTARTKARGAQEGEFVYRDALWHGADMIGLGVASFSYVGGVHFQNDDSWSGYIGALHRGELPLARALTATPHQRLIRELILQLKLGRLDAAYFRSKFGVEMFEAFSEPFRSLIEEDLATIHGDELRLTRSALLRVDGLVPRFFEPSCRSIRYT